MKRILFYASAVAVMFSSCSKDATEVATPSLEGKVQVFSASIDVEKNNSTRMEYDGANYIWALGDAIGVTSLSNLTNGMPEIPSYNTAENTSVASFAVTDSDARHFGDWDKMGDALYFYFPYSSDGKLIKNQDGSVIAQLSIPATQRYAPNTFFKNTVPAIGYVEKYVLGESEVKMNVPVSMIELMVKGFGETDALTLKIQKPNSTGYYNLAGSQEVVIPTDGTKPVFVEPTETSDKITLSFGNQSEGFEYEGAKKVIFVVPAGLELNNATIELSNGNDTQSLLLDFMCTETEGGVNDPNGSYKTQPNKVFALVKGNYDFTFGMDGKFVIEDENETAGEKWNDGYTAEEKFIAYAYLAQHQDAQNNVYPKTDDWKFIAEYLGYDIDWNALGANVVNDSDYQALTTTIAWIKSEKNDGILDFTNYGKQWAIDQKTALNTHLVQGGQDANPSAENKFWLNVYDWYIANEGIESLSYNAIVGDDDINPIVIKGLKVKGSGLIAKSDSAVDVYGNGAKLKNLKFEECIVNGNAFLAYNSNDVLNSFDHVVIGADNMVNDVDGSYVGGLFVAAYASQLATIVSANGVIVDVLPVVDSASELKGQIVGLLQPVANYEVKLSDYKVTSLATPVYGAINGTHAVIVDTTGVTTSAPDNASNAGVVGKLLGTPSIIVDDTAYWNGTAAPSVNEDGVLTAEELAYVLASRNNATIELALNYDMQGGELNLENYLQNPDPMVISGAKTISNLTVNTHNNTYYASLFGKTANLTDLTLKNITVNVVKQVSGTYRSVAGLAQTGTATNVTVDGLTVNLADGVAVNNDIIGGLFSAVAPANLNNVTANKVTLNALESIKTAGIVAGKLNLDANEDNAWTLSGITVSGAKFAGFNTDTVSSKTGDMKTVAGFMNSYGHAANYGKNSSDYKQVPFGYISVNDPKWGIAGNPVVQTLNGVNCNYYRIAARIFVGSDITSDTASVALDSNVSDIHAYQFHMDEVVNGTGYSLTKVGFVNDSSN